jgi:ribosome biogenesis GTPase
MDLRLIGYSNVLDNYIKENNLENFDVGRVVAEHKERYQVLTSNGEYGAEITGNLRFTANGREDFPAVGDWVALTIYDSDFAIIHSILPRYSLIKRKAIAHDGEAQVIAANIDYAFLVQAVDRDFNINRIERYLSICNSSKVNPIIVLSKIDLIDGQTLSELKNRIENRIKKVPVITISNETQTGYDEIRRIIERGKTYCMLGSSGVGKSTLTNNLSGKVLMKTDSISDSTGKGRHITSHREMFILENGGILIDNPGMREVGMTDASGGLEMTFDYIMELAVSCKYSDCNHISEDGCAVIEALEKGELDRNAYANYLKIEKEKAFFESSAAERRQKDKQFGKMLKNYKKQHYKK